MTTKTILAIGSATEINCHIAKIVAKTNFSLITASNERVGLQKIDREKPDFILCQWHDGEIDSHRVLTEIGKNSHTATIPFVFITTQFNPRQWRKAMSLGADDFLIYPFTHTELGEIIKIRLAKQEALVNKYQQELDYVRSSILDFLPHEMRTALTGISASSDLLLNKLEQLDPSVVRELVGCMNLSSQRLLRLVDNFLLYSELNLISRNLQQTELLRHQKTYLSFKTIDSIVTKLDRSHNRRTNICWQAEETFLAINPLHLAKLIEELLDNALKFSAVNTSVLVRGYRNGDYFYLTVIDRGRGMSAKQIAKIGACIQFERPIYEQQGCGLGLAIVQKLVHIYGGKVVINSILERETRVNIYLPLWKSPALSDLDKSKTSMIS